MSKEPAMSEQGEIQVPVSVKSRHLPDNASGSKDYAREKFTRLSRFCPRLQAVEIMLQPEGDQWKCEATLHMERADPLLVQAAAGDLHSAADAAVDKAERQLVRDKERGKERISERRRSKSSGRFST